MCKRSSTRNPLESSAGAGESAKQQHLVGARISDPRKPFEQRSSRLFRERPRCAARFPLHAPARSPRSRSTLAARCDGCMPPSRIAASIFFAPAPINFAGVMPTAARKRVRRFGRAAGHPRDTRSSPRRSVRTARAARAIRPRHTVCARLGDDRSRLTGDGLHAIVGSMSNLHIMCHMCPVPAPDRRRLASRISK